MQEPDKSLEPGAVGVSAVPSVFERTLNEKGIAALYVIKTADQFENITIDATQIVDACRWLKESSDTATDLLVAVTGTDRTECIEVLYHLFSTRIHRNIVLRTKLDRQQPRIDSIIAIHPGAAFHEREVYDLLGVRFNNHPDLKRILLPPEWIGHPLRKDYVENDKRLKWNQR